MLITTKIGRFWNEKLYRYPRMTATDALTWGKFLEANGKEYNSFDYDVRIGTGVIAKLEVPEKFIADYKMLTQKRIDAIGYRNDSVEIFEVKQRAGLSALGQLKAYAILYRESFPSQNIASLNLVCSFITQEERKLYAANNINVYVYPQI